jgi:hypothetical protein
VTGTTASKTYQGVAVPEAVAGAWHTWEAAEWRKMAWICTNNDPYPPDQRFTVYAPWGMCTRHLDMRRRYRDMYFDDRTGRRWPGTPGSPFPLIVLDLRRELAWRRREWDEKASEQMREIERLCLAGTSAQCAGRRRTCTGCGRLTCTCGEAA